MIRKEKEGNALQENTLEKGFKLLENPREASRLKMGKEDQSQEGKEAVRALGGLWDDK